MIELLIFRAMDRFAEDAHSDEPVEGDLKTIDAFASVFTRDDERYQEEREEIEHDPTLSLRDKQFALLGAMARCLKRHGKMDAAPTVVDHESYDFLSNL